MGAAASVQQGPRFRTGALFAGAAGCLALVAQIVGGTVPVALGLLFFALGTAHGAGDEQDGRIARFSPAATLAYVVTGLAVAGAYLASPTVGLSLFFALSLWHFARSERGSSPAAAWAVAALAIGGSALLRRGETGAVLSAITGDTVPGLIVTAFAAIGAAGIAATALSAVRRERRLPFALGALAATALLHPVLAAGLVFFAAHALPAQQRQIAQHGVRRVLRAAAIPTAIAVAGGTALVAAVYAGALPLVAAAALAFGMATPHMLTERLER